MPEYKIALISNVINHTCKAPKDIAQKGWCAIYDLPTE